MLARGISQWSSKLFAGTTGCEWPGFTTALGEFRQCTNTQVWRRTGQRSAAGKSLAAAERSPRLRVMRPRIRTQPEPLMSDDWLDGDDAFKAKEIADAWAEVEQARLEVEQRERDLELREAALRCSEERHRGSVRKLAEMRRRLESYSDELEEAMAKVQAQQDLLREERRRSGELHARARQMLDATRKNGAPRWREGERIVPVSPSP
eukprot:g17429.t1